MQPCPNILTAAIVFGLSNLAMGADSIWDPTEIAALAQQGAASAVNLSVAIELQTAVSSLSRSVGAPGERAALPPYPFPIAASFSGLAMPDSLTSVTAGWLQQRLQNNGLQRSKTGTLMQSAAQQANVDALSVAMVLGQQLSILSDRANLLADNAAQAQDLRSDIEADNNVALALLDRAVAIETELSLLLQVRSTHCLLVVFAADGR